LLNKIKKKNILLKVKNIVEILLKIKNIVSWILKLLKLKKKNIKIKRSNPYKIYKTIIKNYKLLIIKPKVLIKIKL